jgi:hypothetical protein
VSTVLGEGHNAGFAIGVGAGVGRVGDDPMNAGVTRPAPDDIAIGPLGWQIGRGAVLTPGKDRAPPHRWSGPQ